MLKKNRLNRYEQNFLIWTASLTNKKKSALNSYFVPRSSETGARHAFKQTIPKPGESIQQHVVGSKTAVRDCGYGTDANNQIREQQIVLFNCESESQTP